MVISTYVPVVLEVAINYKMGNRLVPGKDATEVAITLGNPSSAIGAKPLLSVTISRNAAGEWPNYSAIRSTIGKTLTADNRGISFMLANSVCKELGIIPRYCGNSADNTVVQPPPVQVNVMGSAPLTALVPKQAELCKTLQIAATVASKHVAMLVD